MSQHKWLDLVKDYDVEILYHPGKENMVANALSRKAVHLVALVTKHTHICCDFEHAKITIAVGEITSQLA